MTPVDRRTLLKGIAAISAAAASSSFPPRDPFAATPTDRGLGLAEPDWRRAPCPLCDLGCGLLVAVERGRAVAVRGDPESPMGKGLACAKGYFSAQALYGRDRITRAEIRRDGRRAAVPMREALDATAQRIRDTVRQYGKDSVALFGSAQWSVTDAYVASKLFHGALGTNNVETSDRLLAAAAMAGSTGTFGLDGAAGCAEDVEHADVFVLWDINLAETEPVLFSRMLDRRRRDPAVRIIDLATRTTRTSYAADQSVLHASNAALAVAHAICHEIVRRAWADRAFVDRYVAFKRGPTDIGYGFGDDAALSPDVPEPASWDDYVEFLSAYSPERVEERSGIPAERIRWLASLYGDRSRRVMSLWGANASQHTRGTWMNNALYNIHLLVGKIASPGNGALCLTGQPSGGSVVHAAGARTDALPRGMVASEADRRRAAGIWGVQQLDAQPTHSALAMFRALDRGDIRLLWIMSANPLASLPNLRRYREAARREGRVLIVSEAYPTPTTDAADILLPAALWFEREGIFGSAERRLQHFAQLVAPPGEAMSDSWQMVEVARRLGFTERFPWERDDHVEAIWEEYRRFHDDPASALPPMATLRTRPGVMWPFVNGRETRWRFSTEHDPAADRARGAVDFYGHPDHRAWIWLRPEQPPAETPSDAYPFWLRVGEVLEHWGTGSMTQRIPTLHRAVPRAFLEMHADDAKRMGVRSGDTVRVASRRGTLDIEVRVDYRSQPPRGQLFVPWFDETLPVRALLLDAFCPISGQPDTAGCAVRVERLTSGGRT
jgi:nitrate reductase (cytochrome)